MRRRCPTRLQHVIPMDRIHHYNSKYYHFFIIEGMKFRKCGLDFSKEGGEDTLVVTFDTCNDERPMMLIKVTCKDYTDCNLFDESLWDIPDIRILYYFLTKTKQTKSEGCRKMYEPFAVEFLEDCREGHVFICK